MPNFVQTVYAVRELQPSYFSLCFVQGVCCNSAAFLAVHFWVF